MAVAGQPARLSSVHPAIPCPLPVEGGSVVTRFITNPRFWVLAFALSWLAFITLLIALGQAVPDASTGAAH
jgi:hypothetical protein